MQSWLVSLAYATAEQAGRTGRRARARRGARGDPGRAGVDAPASPPNGVVIRLLLVGSVPDHRRRALGGAALHGGAHRPGAPLAGHGGAPRSEVAAPHRVGVGQLARLVPAWASRSSWWRPWASAWTAARRPASSPASAGSCPACCSARSGPLGPRVLLFPVELLSARSCSRQVIEWRAPTFDTTSQRALRRAARARDRAARPPALLPVGAARRGVQRRGPAGRCATSPSPRSSCSRSWPRA